MAGTAHVVGGAKGPKEIIGFQQVTGIGASTALTIPGITGLEAARSKVKAALISADGQSIRVRFDAIAPTAAIGHLIANGDHLYVECDLAGIRVIQTAATAVVNVTYFA